MTLEAPFPYFGGKSTVAHMVWRALGQPRHYLEPFFGSGAVLLARPRHDPQQHTETVCDKDGFLANVWRSLQFSPDETARWCDWPVNHADLSARKIALLKNETRLLDSLIADERWHDPVMAGYWIWAASAWIGAGLTFIGQRPHLSNAGVGINKLGQHSQVSDDGQAVADPYNTNLYAWFRQLSERLRYVRVVCGDWMRVCGGNWQEHMGTVGMFFDPPYGVTDRDTTIYHHDSTTVAADVMAWSLERGTRPGYRIVLAGYEEYRPLLAEGWTAQSWKAQGGYSNLGDGQNQNRRRETLYFSPGCVMQPTLFDATA